MTKIININKYGQISEKSVISLTYDNLYKKAGFSKPIDFKFINSWKEDTSYIQLYAKTSGRANNENKYELPPPVDNTIYYGTLVFLKSTEEKTFSETSIIDYSKDEFTKFIDKQFGGFEDIGSQDSSTEPDEIQQIDPKFITKDGYVKDGFVVDSDKETDESDSEFFYDDELQYEEYTDEEDDDDVTDDATDEQ